MVLRRRLAPYGFAPGVRADGPVPPDVRGPTAEVPWQLWRYDQDTARPGVNPPDLAPALIELVADLARSPYGLFRWFREARGIAARVDGDPTHALCMAMVHPPEPPTDLDDAEWIQRWQLACALVLAARPDPWPTSTRKQALLTLIAGPMDWTVFAAALAAVALAWNDD